MAQLLFYDDKHVYELDGVKLPSVSEIIRFISREVYADINQWKLDNAAERGKAIHKACEQIIKFGQTEITEDIAGYVKAFLLFCKEHSPEFIYCEKAMACADFAGTVDIGCTMDKKRTLIDLKSVSAVNKPLVKAQLNGYKWLDEINNGEPVKQLFCLQVLPTAKYRLYPVAIDGAEFDSCLALHKAMAKTHPRGEIA